MEGFRPPRPGLEGLDPLFLGFRERGVRRVILDPPDPRFGRVRIWGRPPPAVPAGYGRRPYPIDRS